MDFFFIIHHNGHGLQKDRKEIKPNESKNKIAAEQNTVHVLKNKNIIFNICTSLLTISSFCYTHTLGSCSVRCIHALLFTGTLNQSPLTAWPNVTVEFYQWFPWDKNFNLNFFSEVFVKPETAHKFPYLSKE